jgi:hypothetical protein
VGRPDGLLHLKRPCRKRLTIGHCALNALDIRNVERIALFLLVISKTFTASTFALAPISTFALAPIFAATCPRSCPRACSRSCACTCTCSCACACTCACALRNHESSSICCYFTYANRSSHILIIIRFVAARTESCVPRITILSNDPCVS